MKNVAIEMEAFEKIATGDGSFEQTQRNYNFKINENNVCNE